ncbi:hypothetical protein [Dinoroseobacter sp. S375]|uniref:hypothetical protein n=1 Tax=Dinoroseobacter sp. S375 TaxID=3415136 RepID=UPI003C7DA1AE
MKALTTLVILGMTATAASAASLDFSGVQGTNVGSFSVPGATVTQESGGNLLVGTFCAGQVDGFCFVSPFGSAAAGGTMDFTSAVTNLTFDIDGWNPGDSVTITAFDDLVALGSSTFTANGVVDFTGFASITSLLFVDNASAAAGVGYSTFEFDLADTAPIPLPAGGLLLLTALGGLALRKYKAA